MTDQAETESKISQYPVYLLVHPHSQFPISASTFPAPDAGSLDRRHHRRSSAEN